MKKQFKRREVIKSGSQTSEPIELTDYVIVQKNGKEVTLRGPNGRRELWIHNQNYAGYVIRIGQKNYEFIRGLDN